MRAEFRTDDRDHVTMQPVTNWALEPVTNMCVDLTVGYLEVRDEVAEALPGHQIHFSLTLEQAQDLASALTQLMQRMPGTRPD